MSVELQIFCQHVPPSRRKEHIAIFSKMSIKPIAGRTYKMTSWLQGDKHWTPGMPCSIVKLTEQKPWIQLMSY